MSWVPLESWEQAVIGRTYRVTDDGADVEDDLPPGTLLLCLKDAKSEPWLGTVTMLRPNGSQRRVGDFWELELEEWVGDEP